MMLGIFKDLDYALRYQKAVKAIAFPGATLTPVWGAMEVGASIGAKHGLSPEEAAVLFCAWCGYDCAIIDDDFDLDHPRVRAWQRQMNAKGRFSSPAARFEVAASDFEILQGEIAKFLSRQPSMFDGRGRKWTDLPVARSADPLSRDTH